MKHKQKALLLFVSLLAFAAPRGAISQNIWTPTNGIYGGLIRQVTPDTGGNVYIGTYDAGIFRSTNNGDSWTEINEGLPDFLNSDGSIFQIISLSTDLRGYVFAIIGEFYFGVSYGNTLFRSSDGGYTWARIPDVDSTITQLVINRENNIFAIVNNGILRSNDQGNTWSNPALSGSLVTALVINNAGYLFALTDSGIFRSVNDGLSWSHVNDTLGSIHHNGIPKENNNGILAVSPKGHIFAVCRKRVDGFFNDLAILYRSVDSGLTWKQIAPDSVFNYFDTNSTFNYDDLVGLSIVSNGDILASIYGGLLRSTDDGVNWSRISDPSDHTWYNAIAPNSKGIIFAGTDRGVLKSSNKGQVWTQSNQGITDARVYSLSIDSSGNMFAATYYGGGVFVSKDAGSNWRLASTGITENHLYSTMATNKYIYAGSDTGKIFRCEIDGEWKLVNTEISAVTTNNSVNCFASNKMNHLFSGAYGGISLSTDDGITWNLKNSGLSGYSQFINALAVNHNGQIFAGTDGGIARSTDDGDSWDTLSNGLTNNTIASLAINSNGLIFAGAQSYGIFDTNHIYLSTDNGNSWIHSDFGISDPIDIDVKGIAVNSLNHVFAGASRNFGDNSTIGGVYFSTDNGNSWTNMRDGLKDYYVRTVIVDKNGYAFAGSRTGVYKTTSSTLTSGVNGIENNSFFELLGNYPNPFKPSTTIRFQLSFDSYVTLKIYDFCGREVTTLLNGHKNSGNYEIPFDGSELPSGIYEYRLQAGNISETRKMSLIR